MDCFNPLPPRKKPLRRHFPFFASRHQYLRWLKGSKFGDRHEQNQRPGANNGEGMRLRGTRGPMKQKFLGGKCWN